MGLITRAEATHRLKIISTKVNNSASAARDGSWKDACESANEAQLLLESLLPHLEEAFDATPEPVRSGCGSMGYRGSAGQTEYERQKQFLKNHTVKQEVWEPKKVSSTFSVSSVVPPPPIVLPKLPIITPAPPVQKIVPPPVMEPEEVWFNPLRMSGPIYAWSCFNDHNTPSLTEQEWEMTELFERQAKEFQQNVIDEYNRTGRPVFCRLKKESK